MIYQETSNTRRVVGRLDEGDECVERLTEFCEELDVRAAEIRAVGRLRGIEVVRFDAESGEYEEMFAGEGPFDLLQMTGNVSMVGNEPVVRLHALLAAEGPVGPQLVAGELRSATTVEFEFVAEIYEDLELTRQLDSESGRLELQSIRKLESADGPEGEGSIEGQAMSWDDAAETAESDASGKSPPEEDEVRDDEPDEPEREASDSGLDELDLEEPMVESGDIIDHPKLGRCRVIKVEEDKYAHIRLPQGKIRKLSLNVVEIAYSGEENGRNVFEAQVSS